jgi:hypothetical protein
MKGFNPWATKAIEVFAPTKAELAGHTTIGTDDALLAVCSTDPGRRDETTSPARLFMNQFDLSLADIADAVKKVQDVREIGTSTGATKGVNKALRLAYRNARQRFHRSYGTELSVDRMDILVGLVRVNDKTFQRVMVELSLEFDDFSYELLKEALKHSRAKAKVHA